MARQLAQKILADHAGLECSTWTVNQSQSGYGTGNDITSPVAISEFRKRGLKVLMLIRPAIV